MHKSYFIIILCLLLAACGSSPIIKRSPQSTNKQPDSSQTSQGGGYYPGDGPHANPPKNIDNIPDAIPKQEPLYRYSTRPYTALGKKYTPLTSAKNYKKRGVASWYGKLFHGNKTAIGETYDMYSMTAAHTVLPLPSYVKVTNLENGRSVIVRVNDRGPFKHEREIDLSYAAAYKLRLIEKGSGLVEVEAIDPSEYATGNHNATQVNTETQDPPANQSNPSTNAPLFIQAGAFGDENNALERERKIEALNIEQNTRINRVYNNGLYRLLVGPYPSRQQAEKIANEIHQKLYIPTIITTQ